jgi:hypothetical protein
MLALYKQAYRKPTHKFVIGKQEVQLIVSNKQVFNKQRPPAYKNRMLIAIVAMG